MKKRRMCLSGLNAITGFGTGEGMRKEFGGWMAWGEFEHREVGGLDAPARIAVGGVHAGRAMGCEDVSFVTTIARGML